MVTLKSIALSSGGSLIVGDEITLIVGPNNVGKSMLLNSAWAQMGTMPGQPPLQSPVVKSVQLDLGGSVSFEARLVELGELTPPGTYPQGTFSDETYLMPNGVRLSLSEMTPLFLPPFAGSSLGMLQGTFAAIFMPEGRLGQLGYAATPNLYAETATQPLQKLWQDRELETVVSDLAKRAFGIELTVNRHAGAQIGLHIGRPSAQEPAPGEKSDYQRQIMELPLASAQGHGVQAFLGMLIAMMTYKYDLVLIDEPEAFLHPPQARLLGEVIVELSIKGTQFLISTHSEDFLQGVLNKGAKNSAGVTVARLTRPDSGTNAIAQVDPKNIRQLYEDPLLRYSNILDGLFYKGVILCEAESDCKYYAAVLDEMFSSDDPNLPRPDLLFTQCGGKDRLHKAASALQAAKVPTAVIADIDLLADEQKFRQLFEQFGGVWTNISGNYNTLVSAVKIQASKIKRSVAKSEINERLESSTNEFLTTSEGVAIRRIATERSGWQLLKKHGEGAIPNGDPTKSFQTISAEAAKIGLFLVQVGELESFHPTIGGTKQSWLREVFESKQYKQSPAASMLECVAAFISSQQ